MLTVARPHLHFRPMFSKLAVPLTQKVASATLAPSFMSRSLFSLPSSAAFGSAIASRTRLSQPLLRANPAMPASLAAAVAATHRSATFTSYRGTVSPTPQQEQQQARQNKKYRLPGDALNSEGAEVVLFTMERPYIFPLLLGVLGIQALLWFYFVFLHFDETTINAGVNVPISWGLGGLSVTTLMAAITDLFASRTVATLSINGAGQVVMTTFNFFLSRRLRTAIIDPTKLTFNQAALRGVNTRFITFKIQGRRFNYMIGKDGTFADLPRLGNALRCAPFEESVRGYLAKRAANKASGKY